MSEAIQMVALAERHAAVQQAVESRVLAVLRGGHYVGGPLVAEAEALAARWLGRRDAVGVNSGTDALCLSLQALGVGPGDEVVVPALSFFATAGAVCAIGSTPVFADVGPDGCLDPIAAAEACGPRTRALIPVQMFGQRCAAPPVSLPLIDDAAQAIGADPPVCVGVISALSAYPTKTWGAAGDAGFVASDQPELLRRVRALGHHGASERGYQRVGGQVGRNSRLDAIQAAVLLGHATRLTQRVARRRQLATRYDAGLPSVVQPLPRGPGHPVQQYVVRTPRRAEVQAALHTAQIQSRIYYPRPLCDEPAFDHISAHVPVARALCQELLALPVHAELHDSAVDRVCAVITEALA